MKKRFISGDIITIMLFLIIVVTAPLLSSRAHVEFAANMFLATTSLTFLFSITSRNRAAIDFVFSFFFLFFLALPARFQISADAFPWNAHLQYEHQITAFAVMAMSYAAYLVARLYVIRFPPKREALPPRGRRPERFFTYWAWAFAVIAIVFGAVAGPGNLFAARFAEGRSEMAGMSQQFLYMARSLSLLAMVMMIYLSRYAQARKLRRRNFLAIFVFLPAFLVINYYAALPRFVLFGSLLALVVNFVDFTRPPMKILVTGGAIFTLFAVFPIIKLLGTGTATLSELVAASGSVRIDRYFLNVDFDGYMQIVSTVAYIAEGGELRWGNNFLGVALFFVPRALWAGKPIDSGEIVSTNLSYWYTNVSSPLPAESLISFNLFGPPIVFFHSRPRNRPGRISRQQRGRLFGQSAAVFRRSVVGRLPRDHS